MSTILCPKIISYLINSKHLRLKKSFRKSRYKCLTGRRVSKAGRADLHCRSPYCHIVQHIAHRFDAPKTNNGDRDRLGRLPNQSQSDRLDRRTREAAGLVPQLRFSRAKVHGHRRVGIGHGESIRPSLRSRPGYDSDVRDHGRKLHPKGSARRRFARSTYYLGHQRWVAPELHPSTLYVGAGDVQLVARQALSVFEVAYDLNVIFYVVAKHVCNHCGIAVPKQGQPVAHKGFHTNVLQADGIQHAGRRNAEPRRGGSFHGLAGQTLGNETADFFEIYEVGKFQAVTKRAASRNNGIPQTQRANLYAQIDFSISAHFGPRISRSHRNTLTIELWIFRYL